MDVGLVTSVMDMKQSQMASQVQIAVAQKMMSMTKQQGAAITQMIQAAADVMEQSSSQSQQSVGRLVDVVA